MLIRRRYYIACRAFCPAEGAVIIINSYSAGIDITRRICRL